MLSSFASALVAWLATYALHSTVLSLVVLAVAARIKNDAWKHTLLSAALFAGLVTATLAPLGPGRVMPLVSESTSGESTTLESTIAAGAAASVRPHRADRVLTPSENPLDAKLFLAAGWAAVALGLVGRRLLSLAILHMRLAAESRRRPPVSSDVETPATLFGLDRDGAPFVLGSKIYVPLRSFSRLTQPQQAAVLAHETAHVVRRDGWSFGAALLVQDLFFFQPLHRIVRRQLFRTAERLCDQWAVTRGTDPLELAGALTRMARLSITPVPSLSAGGGSLTDRVRELARAKMSPAPRRRWPRRATALMLSLAVSAAMPHATAQIAALATLEAETWVGWTFPASLRAPTRSATPEARHPRGPAVQQSALPSDAVVVWIGSNERGEPVEVSFGSVRTHSTRAPGEVATWGGLLSSPESIDRLETISRQARSPTIRAELAAATAIHREAAATMAAAERTLRSESSALVRAELLSWLGRRGDASAGIAGLLERIAVEDPSPEVQAEALDALARLGHLDSLQRLSTEHPSAELREEATELRTRAGAEHRLGRARRDSD